jgi:hypothetical protein
MEFLICGTIASVNLLLLLEISSPAEAVDIFEPAIANPKPELAVSRRKSRRFKLCCQLFLFIFLS